MGGAAGHGSGGSDEVVVVVVVVVVVAGGSTGSLEVVEVVSDGTTTPSEQPAKASVVDTARRIRGRSGMSCARCIAHAQANAAGCVDAGRSE
jgi:hypothetical protein